jgi:CRP-like cAMP-binding protein
MYSAERPSNHFLAILSDTDFDLLKDDLVPMDLTAHMILATPSRQIEHVYFPESGIVSISAVMHDSSVELGIVGVDGFIGHSAILSDGLCSTMARVQIAGRGLRIGAGALKTHWHASASLLDMLNRFIASFTAQMISTAFANTRATIPARVARRLLLIHDRSPGDSFSITHEALSFALSVRRASVTEALKLLVYEKTISTERSRVTILDRDRLAEHADGTYGVAESEQARLTGWRSKLFTCHQASSCRTGSCVPFRTEQPL